MAKKKVIPYPVPLVPHAEKRFDLTIQVGSQEYAIEVSCRASAKLERSGCVVQTRYLHLLQPAILGSCIDGWQVCWIGGWDKGKVFFLVMVKRTIRRQSDLPLA
jgi:hypothetical protein